MDNKARPSTSKIKPIISTSSAEKKRRQSDDYESEGSEEYSHEGVYSHGSHEEELSSSSEGSSASDLSIFETRSKSKTTSHRPRAGDIPAQTSRSQASKRGLSESGGSPIIQPKRLKAMVSDGRKGAEIPGTHDTTTWSSNPISMKTIDFTKEQELLVPPPSDPYDAFRLLIDDDLLDLIVRETNAKAVRVGVADNVKRNSRINNWKDLTREELKTFLGLLLHTGTIRLNRISDYWKRHYLFNIPCFGQFMSRNRFLLILRCLHFTSESSEEDRLVKIRPIMDHFNNKLINIYCPGKQLSLDESMVLWRGRLLFRQYIKNKRHKYGIKLYVLAEPDGTVLKSQVFAGANDETPGKGHGSKIVLKLLEDRLDCGHHVYMDNYYNSYGLAVKLLDRKTYCTGMLSKNRRDNPVEIGTISLEKGENKSFFLNGVHIGKWRDKRYVVYISTEHGDEMVETTSKRGSVVLKPSAIVHYNNFMSGIDLQDRMLAYYPVQRKTLRWYKKLFVHMLQMSLSNALYLYNKFSANDKMNLYDFRLKILERLFFFMTNRQAFDRYLT
ncbi:unnamed protein product [Euphydryas editha]|uniref:PiggyBac transposable element-derived protein domain-containing protein n=1 Tax=Euphydryas editha TaxID=104508 RepID=A0AAU9TYR3_EUPED|nr:unnamed protein product [Euphydryas editha]